MMPHLGNVVLSSGCWACALPGDAVVDVRGMMPSNVAELVGRYGVIKPLPNVASSSVMKAR